MRPAFVLFTGLAVLATASSATRAADRIDFSRDIRPILSGACFACHGPDEGERQADLRLDTREGAFADLGGYHAIVPGKPDESTVIERITSADPDLRMPPADSGKKLTAKQIELLRAWIEQGANWAGHWSFTAPVRPQPPAVKNAGWVRNPIDAFILARLEREGLTPSPEADRVTLLRRLSLDLVGLPPEVSQVDAFLADESSAAYQRQIERLLDSPHYGERWARHWLDAARYADSDGFEKDKPRQVWFYRDWVINALNRDLPYDRFVIEQIAGDLLSNATQDQIVATGFLRNSMINEEGGIDPEQFRMEAMFDRMEAVGKGILGLTIQCAQCHNHKFDPLTQEEYYRLFAFLNNSYEANATVYTSREHQQRSEIFRRIRELEAELQHRTPDWQARMADWESQATDQTEWSIVLPAVEEISTGGQKYKLLEDGSLLAQGYAPTKHRAQFSFRFDGPVSAFRLELLNHPNLPHGGPGRSVKGTAALTEFEVEAIPQSDPKAKPTKVKFTKTTADIELPETALESMFGDKTDKQRVTGPVAFAIDGKDDTAWGIDAGPGRSNQPRKAVFTAEQPIAHDGGTILTVYLSQKHGGWNSDDNQTYNLGRFRISVTAASDAVADSIPAHVREILTIPASLRSESQVAAVFSYWRTIVAEWREPNDQIEALWREHPAGASQLVLHEREADPVANVLDRGDFLKPKAEVSPGVPSFLHSLPEGAPANRLTFAQWLVDRDSPTVARSIVNRVWQSYFGIGLVSTSEDLGSQSEAPSHPELLDWLAVEFMDSGWSLKKLHRLIVDSATYRQSSHVTPQLLTRDPYNRLLGRMSRFRVDAEIVRDVMLAASGLLNPQVGGPSVYPPAPAFLFEPPASYGPKVWSEATGADRYRRALYTFRFRSVPYPVLQTFDAPNGEFSCVRRARSNTPLQSLATLNEPLFMECARALAMHTITEGGADNVARMAYAFRRCLSRTPAPDETRALVALLDHQLTEFSRDGSKPWELAAADPEHPPALPKDATPAELAAWTAVSRVLLNLDETITKE